jgi:integrase
LGGCFDFAESHTELPATFHKLLPAARNMIARRTGHALDDLPADPAALRPLLAKLDRWQMRLSGSRWSAMTMLRSVLVLAGWHAPEAARRTKLPDAWEDLLVAAHRHGRRRALATFFRHCHRTGRTLDTIGSEALVDFEFYLTHSTLDPEPHQTMLRARSAWAFMQTNHCRWVRQELRPPQPPRASASDRQNDEPLIGASGLASRALVSPSARLQTLAACFDFVLLHPDVPETFRCELPLARELLDRATGGEFANLLPDPAVLGPLIARTRLHKRRVRNKRWNAATILRSVLILTAWHSPEARLRYKLPQDWEALLIAAGKHGHRRALAAFMRHAHRLGLSLPEIDSNTLVSYVDWLSQWTLNPDPWQTARSIVLAWKKMRTHHRAWPATDVALPPFRTSTFAARPERRNEPLLGARFLANRSLIADEAARPCSLGACLDFVVRHPDVPEAFRTDLRRVGAALTRVTGSDPATMPTDPVVLRSTFARVQPIQFGLSTKTWQNIKALVASTLTLCGWLPAASRKRYVLPSPWSELAGAAKRSRLDKPLVPFFRFCHRLGLTPDGISSETLYAYLGWTADSTLKVNAWRTAQAVQRAWGRMQRSDTAWPAAELRLPSRMVHKCRTDFAVSFYADLSGYLDSLRKYHPRDPTYRHPLANSSIRTVKESILRAATYLTNEGTPISEITGINTLVKPEHFEEILLAALNDAGGRWSVLAKHIADNLFLAARRWVKSSEEVLKDLQEQTRCVQVQRDERRRRQLLAQFATQEDRDALFGLPWRAFEQADLMLKQAVNPQTKSPLEPAAKLHEEALALALLFTQPIRIGNLVALDINHHLWRDRRGKLTRVFIDAQEVKNGLAIEILLPEPVVARFERHFSVFRPILLRQAVSNALFVGKAGKPLSTQSLGKRLRRLVERQLGSRFTPHLARHLEAEMLLEDNPNNLPLAQRLLGHTLPSTTAKIYGGLRTSAAQGALARLVETDRLVAEAKDRKKRDRLARAKIHDRH